jgi:thiol:disulfide interchange protein DsbD
MIVALVGSSAAYFIGDKFQSAQVPGSSAELAGDWHAFSAERLRSELDQGHAVFVDFTAAWCLNCKFNEGHVLENSAVREAFQRHGVTKLKADWTNGDPVITKFLQQFGRVGVPLYVLYPGKSEEPIVFPELLTKSIVLEKLETIRTVASQ